MKTFYQMSGEDTMKQLNGSAEPLTESQVKEHQERARKRRCFRSFLNSTRTFLLSS